MGALADFSTFIKGNFGGLLSGGLGTYAYGDQMDKSQSTQSDVTDMFNQTRTAVGEQGNFTPYGMTSGIGSSGYDAQGNQTFGLSNPQQAYSDQMRGGSMDAYGRAMGPNAFGGQAQSLFGRATGDNQMQNMGMQMTQRSMQDQAGREGDIYERMRAMQSPGEERQREQMTGNLFGSGRGGMGSGQYGASPEEHGFNMARGEAMNQASMQAMGQALQEQTAQSQMGQSMYGQGMQERQMYDQMGAQRYGLGQQDQNMYGQLGGQMGQAQYDPYKMLQEQNSAAMGGAQMQNQSGQAMAGLLAQLGIGESTAAVNFGNNEASMFAAVMEALGQAAKGIEIPG